MFTQTSSMLYELLLEESPGEGLFNHLLLQMQIFNGFSSFSAALMC